MIEIEKPQIECIETPGDASYGKYVIEPLERGYGTTLGNALRRIMLSSLPGTAATSIKIAGVQHEFSTVPGVKEDVTEIVLNVKSLLTKLHCDGPKTVLVPSALWSLVIRLLTLRTISVTSSLTPGMVENSCCTPAILMAVAAVPGSEESIMRRRALPSVMPYPRSKGSTTYLP